MIRKEGALSIFKGLSASIVRESTYSGLRIGLYDISKATIVRLSPGGKLDEKAFVTKLGAGMVSGMMGAAIANPADLVIIFSSPPLLYLLLALLSGWNYASLNCDRTQIKVRMQAPGAVAMPLRAHAAAIYNDRGLAGLYRAVWPTTIRAGLLTSTQVRSCRAPLTWGSLVPDSVWGSQGRSIRHCQARAHGRFWLH
jgi:hypothetical protein